MVGKYDSTKRRRRLDGRRRCARRPARQPQEEVDRVPRRHHRPGRRRGPLHLHGARRRPEPLGGLPRPHEQLAPRGPLRRRQVVDPRGRQGHQRLGWQVQLDDARRRQRSPSPTRTIEAGTGGGFAKTKVRVAKAQQRGPLVDDRLVDRGRGGRRQVRPAWRTSASGRQQVLPRRQGRRRRHLPGHDQRVRAGLRRWRGLRQGQGRRGWLSEDQAEPRHLHQRHRHRRVDGGGGHRHRGRVLRPLQGQRPRGQQQGRQVDGHPRERPARRLDGRRHQEQAHRRPRHRREPRDRRDRQLACGLRRRHQGVAALQVRAGWRSVEGSARRHHRRRHHGRWLGGHQVPRRPARRRRERAPRRWPAAT